MARRTTSTLSEWWKILAMGTALAGMVFVAFFHEPSRDELPIDGPAVRSVKIATPELDPAKLSIARDGTRSERLIIEPEPLAHLLEQSLDIVPSVAKALGLPEEQIPVTRLRANPNAYRGHYLWYKGQLQFLSRGKAGHPIRGYRIWEGWLETDAGEPILFRVSLEPRDVAVGDFVRIEGFFLKLHDRHDSPRADQIPVLVGPELFADFPPWTDVTELDPEIMAQVEDSWDPNDPSTGGAWDALFDSQYLPLWHLTSYARTKDEATSEADWRAVPPFVRKEQLDRVREGDMPRGEPVRVLGAFIKGQTWEARPNPLGIEYWSEAWIQVHDLSAKLVPIWVPERIDTQYYNAPLDVHAFYFKRRLYDTAKGVRITPQFVAPSLHPFTPRPEHSLTSVAKWSFLGVVLAVIALFISIGLRDRWRHQEHQREMDGRRRKRREALSGAGE